MEGDARAGREDDGCVIEDKTVSDQAYNCVLNTSDAADDKRGVDICSYMGNQRKRNIHSVLH